MTQIWFPAPKLNQIESLIADILPEAVVAENGLLEPSETPGVFQIALSSESEDKLDLQGVSLVSPYLDKVQGEVCSINIGSRLIHDFSERAMDEKPVEVLRLKLLQPKPPQRVIEKLRTTDTISIRPSRVVEGQVLLQERLWVHSIFLAGWESVDEGLSMRHFLQDSKGRVFDSAEKKLLQLDFAALGVDFEKLKQLPQSICAKWQGISPREIILAEFAKELQNKEREELSKAIGYYERLEMDLQNRLEQASKKSILTALKNKLEAVQGERSLRISAIRERFQSQLSFEPIGARCLLIPTYFCEIRPEKNDSKSDSKHNSSNNNNKAVIRIPWCPLLKEFLPIECPSCGEYAKDFVLKEASYECVLCEI